MANFTENTGAAFDPVRIIETNDPVLGGAAEISGVVNSPYNHAARSLVNRTIWLKEQIEALNIPDAVLAATTGTAGISRLATLQEMRDGTINDAVVSTPRGVKEAIDTHVPSIPNATAAQRGIIEIVNDAEAVGATDTIRAMNSYGTFLALRHSNAQATTTQRGTVILATESDVANEQNTGRVVTINSLYRQEANTDVQSSDLSTVSTTLITLTNLNLSITVQKYFGPILYEGSILTITGNASTSSSSSIFILDITSIDLANYTWTLTTVGTGIHSLTVVNDGLRVSVTQPSQFSFEITGTPN